jgi:ABC-type multidrug transport system fused ATPase/permease subunit
VPGPQLVIRSGPLAGRRITVDRPLTVGRTQGDVMLDDIQVSRRHALLRPASDATIVVQDLGSTNGTVLNGRPLSGPARLFPGDRLTLGTTILELAEADSASGTAPAASAQTRLTERPQAPQPPAPEFEQFRAEGAIIAYRPGTVGASLAADTAAAVASARRRLQPLIERTGDLEPRILLVDPFPDVNEPGRLVARGTVVDAANAQIWIVVTAEAPPEPPERALALVFGARLPAGEELALLVEGWGIRAARTPNPDQYLAQVELPPLAQAEGDLRTVMARSFVEFLIAQAGEDSFLGFLASAQPGRADDAAREAFGDPLDELEQRWRESLRGGAATVRPARFLRLALHYLRPYVAKEIEVLLLSALSLAFTVAFPFALRELLDSAIPSGQFSEVLPILAFLGAAFAVTLLASLRQTYLVVYVGASVIRDIRLRMFERMQALEPGWFTQRESGDVLARVISDVETLEMGLSQSLRLGVVQLVTLVVMAVTALILNPLLAGVVLLGAPVVALIYRRMAAEAQRRSLTAQERLGDVTGVVAENLAAQPVVTAFGLERREVERLQRKSDELRQSDVRLHLFGGLFSVSVEMVTTLLRLAVLALGAYLIFEGNLTIGGLVAFTTIMSQVLAPVTVLTSIGQQIQTSTGALVRINEVLEALPDVGDAPDAKPLPRLSAAIELRDVSFSYTPERRVLHGVSAVIPAGSRVAFVGPSGAGKSSILQLLMRFQDPDEGEVLLDGVDLRAGTLESLRAQTGVVFQDSFLFNASIRENIAVGRLGASEEEVEAAGKAARLDDFVADLAEGWDTNVGERGGRLSGGQRQRVAIARALLRDPAILLLDEATSALDPRTEHEITDTLEAAASGRTTVAITHRLLSIRHYDRIFVVVDGRLVEQGTHEELIAAEGAYASLWAEQHGTATPTAELDLRASLDLVEAELQPLDLQLGGRLAEGGGRLALVARGSGVVMVPGIGGGLVEIAELQPGQAFGLSALLGDESGSVLEAGGPLSLLVLDDRALRGLAARLPSVASAVAGQRPAAARPTTGQRLGPASGIMQRPDLTRIARRGAAAGMASSAGHNVPTPEASMTGQATSGAHR